MAALVATKKHLWLNLSDMQDKDRFFFLDALLSPSGLFGDAVNTVIERFQEARKQAAAFQRFLAEREQPQPSSFSYCQAQKQSVATRTPPQTEHGSGRCSWSGSSKQKTDLQTVILSKKTSAKWS